jgi:LPXTG-motif cell wall-anchored protein
MRYELAATMPDKLLPDTGGMPLFGLAAIGLAAIVAGVFVLWAVMSRRP